MDERVIAIDGPAGSGKSTAARRLAEAIGFVHLNTGAMYRAVTHLALESGIDLNDEERVSDVADAMKFDYKIIEGAQHFIVNKNDLTHELFTASLTKELKPVVNNPAVRGVLVKKMRDAVHHLVKDGIKGVVMEGRDIGTVVFPDSKLKFYIHADLDTRTKRRAAELAARGEKFDMEGLKRQIKYRDETDEQREIGALKQAHDAIDIDTSQLDEAATLNMLLEEVRKKGLA
ncbi:MAG TPA: (d)CMP kinase [Planctomycetota bacterium]|nr:(d)CMP kinase [Planctomycetota bacterium]